MTAPYQKSFKIAHSRYHKSAWFGPSYININMANNCISCHLHGIRVGGTVLAEVIMILGNFRSLIELLIFGKACLML